MTRKVKKLIKERLGSYYHDTDDPHHKNNTCKRIRYDTAFGDRKTREAVNYVTKRFNADWSINNYGIYIK